MDFQAFIRDLFDLSFKRFITVRWCKWLFLISVGFASLEMLVFLFMAAAQLFTGDGAVMKFLGFIELILVPIFYIVEIIFIRIFYELIVVIFRIEENTRPVAAAPQ